MTPAWVRKEMLAGWIYVDQGRDFAARRVDCWGFLMALSRAHLGHELPDLIDTYDGPTGHARTIAAARLVFEPVPLASARLGDVVYVQLPEHPAHCGLYTGAGHMIHLDRYSRVSHPSLTALGRRVEGVYRHVG